MQLFETHDGDLLNLAHLDAVTLSHFTSEGVEKFRATVYLSDNYFAWTFSSEAERSKFVGAIKNAAARL